MIIDILIVPQHLLTGVTNELQFVLICTGNSLHKGGKCMTARVGGVTVALGTSLLINGVIDSTGVQYLVK